MKYVALFVSFLLSGLAYGKLFERCQLARVLMNVHEAPTDQLATWVCIAKHESDFDTTWVGSPDNLGNRGHGLFQIDDKDWCSPPGDGKGCGLPCAKFEDDNIADDFACAQNIFNETRRLKGNGFKAWKSYEQNCQGIVKAAKHIENCF